MRISIIIYLIGLLSCVSAVYLAYSAEGYPKDFSVLLPILIIISTAIIDILWKQRNRYYQSKKLDPLYDLSRDEKKALLSLSDVIISKNQKEFGTHLLIAAKYNSLIDITERHKLKHSFIYDDLIGANGILINALSEGDTFLGVSLLTNPLDWKDNRKRIDYLNVNIAKALQKVIIERIFVIENNEQFKLMIPIFDSLSDAGCCVRYVCKDKLNGLGFYPDISIFLPYNLGLYVPLSSSDPCISVTQTEEILNSLKTQYSTIKSLAKVYKNNVKDEKSNSAAEPETEISLPCEENGPEE